MKRTAQTVTNGLQVFTVPVSVSGVILRRVPCEYDYTHGTCTVPNRRLGRGNWPEVSHSAATCRSETVTYKWRPKASASCVSAASRVVNRTATEM